MRNIFFVILLAFSFTASAQIPSWYDLDNIDIRRNASTINTFGTDSSVSYVIMNRDTNGIASSCLFIGDSARYYRCTHVSATATWVTTNVPNIGPVPDAFSMTYAQASDSSAAGALVPLAWYNITDDSIYLQAVTDSTFALDGYYMDSVIWELDKIEFDFGNEHIQRRIDKRNNDVSISYNVMVGFGLPNPISVFAWGDDQVNGNYVKDAVLDLTGKQNLVIGQVVLGQSEVIITTSDLCLNNTFDNASLVTISGDAIVSGALFNDTEATISSGVASQTTAVMSTLTITGGGAANAYIVNSTVDIANTANCNGCNISYSTVDISGASNSTSSDIKNSFFTSSGIAFCEGCSVMDSSTVVLSDSTVASWSHISKSTFTSSNQANCRNLKITEQSVVTASNFANINSSVVSQSSTFTAIDNAISTNSNISSGSMVSLSEYTYAAGINIYESRLTASGRTKVGSALLREYSILTVTDTVEAFGIELWEGDTVTLSGTVNAINVRAYTGSDITASGSVFIEGLIIQNVSKLFASGSGRLSPGLICNQSTVTISDTVQLHNLYVSSSTIGFSDSVNCPNCWFYTVTDSFTKAELDTTNYSILNRNTYTKQIDTDKFSLTDGTQGVGKVLTDVTGSGNGTWQPSGAQSFQSANATDGGTTNANTGVRTLKLKPAGVIAAHTVNFPPTPVDGQLFSLTSNGVTITSLTLAAGANTIVGALTTIATGGATWVYDATDSEWSRVD